MRLSEISAVVARSTGTYREVSTQRSLKGLLKETWQIIERGRSYRDTLRAVDPDSGRLVSLLG